MRKIDKIDTLLALDFGLIFAGGILISPVVVLCGCLIIGYAVKSML